MKLKEFLLVLVLFTIGIFFFMMFFIPPIEWQSIINYFLVTSIWGWIGQTGYLIFAALFCTAGYFFIKGVLSS